MQLLLATGGSLHSEAALRLGAYLIRLQQRCLQHLAGMPTPEPILPTILTVVPREAETYQARPILDHARTILAAEVSIREKVRYGNRSREILREAQEGQYDLVLLGKRPRHRLTTRVFGSTAARVAEDAPCSVLIAKGEIHPIQRILLCDSGAHSSDLLDRFIRQFPCLSETNAEVTILHVMSQISAGSGRNGRQLKATTRELIQTHTPEGELIQHDVIALQRIRIHAHPKVRHGVVVDEILSEAHQGNYNLVIIGASYRQGWQSFLLENLERQIITRSDRSVLVLR